jgi:hypothetical protein
VDVWTRPSVYKCSTIQTPPLTGVTAFYNCKHNNIIM